MVSPLLVDHGAAATAVQKMSCRAAAAYASTAAAAASAAAVLLLLLHTGTCYIRVPLLRVPKKICCAPRCQPIFFFNTWYEICIFGDRNAISAIRSSQTQSELLVE